MRARSPKGIFLRFGRVIPPSLHEDGGSDEKTLNATKIDNILTDVEFTVAGQ